MVCCKSSCTFLSLITFLILLASPRLESQTKKGFKYLEKKEWDKAKTAFEKDLSDPQLSFFARFGLLKIRNRTNAKNIDSLVKKAEDLSQLLIDFDALTRAQLKLAQKYEVRKGSISSLKKNTLNQLADAVLEANSLNIYDKIAEKHPEWMDEMKDKLVEMRESLVYSAYEKANDYDELTSIYKNHRLILNLKNLRFDRNFDSKILNLFLKKYSYSELLKFKKDHPNHFYSFDCWFEQFVDSVKTGDSKSVLRFLNNYPYSVMDRFANRFVIDNPIKNGSEEELNRQSYVQMFYNLNSTVTKVDTNNSQAFFSQVKEWMNMPYFNYTSYNFLSHIVQALLDAKADSLAIQTLDMAKQKYKDGMPENCEIRYAFYLNKENWFDNAQQIIQRARQNLNKKNIAEVNTSRGHEFSPVVDLSGQIMYFAASGRQDNIDGEDIFESIWDGSKWAAPKIVKELSGKFDQSPLSITADAQTMLISNNGKLFVSNKIGEKWGKPDTIKINLKFLKWIGKATLSADGNTIIFEASISADALQTQESTILLFVMHKNENNEWGMPEPLPRNINSPRYQTRAPFLHPDGKTLYFSSDKPTGLGEADLYMTTRLSDDWLRWSDPKNLGKEFNSTFDDWGINFSVSLNGSTAYIASEKSIFETQNRFDIYSVDVPLEVRPQRVAAIMIQATNGIDSSDLSGDIDNFINVIDLDTKQIINTTKIKKNGSTVLILPKGKKYSIVSNLKNNLNIPQEINLRTDSEFSASGIDILNTKIVSYSIPELIKKDLALPLKTVYFTNNSSNLSNQPYPELDRIVPILKNEPYIIEIYGYTDNTGSPEYNLKLSEDRANAVKKYFMEKGISEASLVVFAMGIKNPVANNDTEENKSKNRRVEFKLKQAQFDVKKAKN